MTMQSKREIIMSKAQQYMAAVKECQCVLCDLLGQEQAGPTYVHHIRDGHGISQRASDYLTCALCYDCHQGDLGLHGNRTLLKIANVSELDLLAATIKAVFSK